ncbi:MAG TPA: YgaP-like transmembrane domain [Fimbriimonadaceae bacterium]|nr:YgaP-like transmembrane domain [Fimbriimonadaceae bacterium]
MSMTIERAILLVVGVVVLASVLLAVYHSMNWLWLTGLMGAHLIQASFTGIWPVVMALKRMGLASKPAFA